MNAKNYYQFFKDTLCERKISPKLARSSDRRTREFVQTYLRRRAFKAHDAVCFMNTFARGEGMITKEDVELLQECAKRYSIYPQRSVMRTFRNWDKVKHKIKTRSDSEFGISYVPRGSAFYNMLIRQTIGMSVSRVRALGQKEYETALSQLLRITKQKTLEDAANACKKYESFDSYKDVERLIQTILTKLVDLCKHSFGRIPDADDFPPIRVQKLKPGSSVAYYELPEATCEFPLGAPGDKGRVVVQIEDLQRVDVAEITLLIAHEVFPGHFYQIIMYPTPPFVYANWYVEGWALYTERVCDALGTVYVAARLLMRILRAARCIIDPMIHADGITFAEAKEKFAELVPHLSPQMQTAELIRYAAMPAQACGYLPGAVYIEKWSKKFHNLKHFHHVLLSGGAGSVEYVRSNLFPREKHSTKGK
jgi:uncharacterized protein (DUF885 family)